MQGANVFTDTQSPMAQRHQRIDHIIAQQTQSSKYDDHVIDYNGQPLSAQPEKQAQQATIHLQVQPQIEHYVSLPTSTDWQAILLVGGLILGTICYLRFR